MQLHIVIAQINLTVGDVAGNTARVLHAYEQARAQGAHIAVFPELTLTSYPPEDLLLRPGLSTQIAAALTTLQRAVSGCDLLIGYPHRDEERVTNRCAVLRDGSILTHYDKQHLPNYSVFDEQRYFRAGNETCVFDLRGVATAISICEDIWQPQTVLAACARGARLMLNINASPYHTGKVAAREAMLKRAAQDGNMPVVYANLVGGQDELVFDGGSTVVDARGEVVGRAPDFREALHSVTLDTTPASGYQLHSSITPPLEDIASVYEALVLGIADYARKNHFRGALLGLSGGVDSAVTLALAVAALGHANVQAVLMPSPYTADMSVADARAQADTQQVTHTTIAIEPAMRAFQTMLAPQFAGLAADTTEENIQARARGVVLMALSNKTGKLLLTTGNKSEMAVGYATLYGDMAGGFAPLKDVPKMQVYALARYINREGEIIPPRALTRAPSAELKPNQTDQDSLPPYEILDEILRRYIEEDQTPAAIAAGGFDLDRVRQVTRMVDRNEYKRRQAAPGVRLSQRAFGRDRRYPITSAYREQ